MKTLRLPLMVLASSVMVSLGCQKNARDEIQVPVINSVENNSVIAATGGTFAGKESGTCNPYAYYITLESKTQVNGNWEWIWSVQNSNPGNGKNNGTIQDLSHWGMQLGACVGWPSIVSAAFSGDGTSWTYFTPVNQPDPSQNCMTTPVLNFDFGTTGSSKSYYKLVVNVDYEAGSIPGYYKSGAITGCCTFEFDGIGCEGEIVR